MSFWENKLNNKTSSAPVVTSRDLFGLYQPVHTPQPQQPQQSIQTEEEYKPSVPMTAGSRCPGCGTESYRQYGSYAITCSECGYHPRFTQEGSGIRVPQEPGKRATPAKQLDAMGTNLKGQIAQMNANQHANISNIQPQ